MSNIKYNEEQEAYELPYKMWDKSIIVRFYTDAEETIIDNLSEIAVKLETINGSKKRLARMIADEGLYEGAGETLAKELIMDSIYVDIDDGEIVVCFVVSSEDGYMMPLNVELYGSDLEITGETNY
ncbi:MAG: hypothetical protein J6K77_00515 [Ruminococcus sp.]|nr:hypothetical protein [Ruminococcus sp.]